MDKQSIRFEIYGQLNFLSHPLNEKLQRSRDCARSFSLIRKPLFDGQVWCFKWLNNHVKNIQISLIYLYRRTLSSDALKLKQAMHFNGTSFIERVTYTQIAQAKAIHLEKRKKVIHWFDDTFSWKVSVFMLLIHAVFSYKFYSNHNLKLKFLHHHLMTISKCAIFTKFSA